MHITVNVDALGTVLVLLEKFFSSHMVVERWNTLNQENGGCT